MNFQRRQLNNRTVRIDDLENLVARFDKSLLKRRFSQVYLDPMNRHGLLTQRHIHGGKTVIGRRIQSVEEVNHRSKLLALSRHWLLPERRLNALGSVETDGELMR